MMWSCVAYNLTYDLTCSRSDTNQASDHALGGPNHRGLSKENNVKHEPGEEASSCAHMGVKNGKRRIRAHSIRITAVEPSPPHPQQTSPSQHQQYVVWRKPLPILARSRSHLHSKVKIINHYVTSQTLDISKSISTVLPSRQQ